VELGIAPVDELPIPLPVIRPGGSLRRGR